MADMRYRRPSVKTILGVTRLKKRAKKALGINAIMWPFRAVGNYQRRVLRRAGYYDPEMKMMRAMQRGQMPGPLGPIQVSEGKGGKQEGPDTSAFLMAALAQQLDDDDGKGRKKRDDGPGLADALLLATALSGTRAKDEEMAKAGHAHAARSSRGAVDRSDAVPAARPRRRARREHTEQPRHRGLRLFGLLLTALLVAAAIITVWYFWLA